MEEDFPSEETIIEHLFNPTEEELRDEHDQLSLGFIPERWRALRQYERMRLGSALTIALLEQTPNETEHTDRGDLVWQSLHTLLTLLPIPDREGYYYDTHRDLAETLERIVDIKATEQLIPAPDTRLPFSLSKREVINLWLAEGIEDCLRDYESLTQIPLEEMPPLTQEQFDTIVEFLAASGIPLRGSTEK